MSKKKQREEEQHRQLNDYTKPDEFRILKKKTIKELSLLSLLSLKNNDDNTTILFVIKSYLCS